jgi:hypothetical protein
LLAVPGIHSEYARMADTHFSLRTVKLALQLGRRRATTGGVPSGVR